VRLTVVGCAGSYPNASSPASCYLIEHDGARIVLDLGNGSLGALQQYLDPAVDGALDAVVLSHCHVDHCADVASLYVMRHYGPTPATRPMPLIGPSDTRERIAAIYGMADPAPLDRQFDTRTLGASPLTVGPFRIEGVPADHPVEAYSIRVTADGLSITYSGDTAPTRELVDLARGTDIALFEASFVGTHNPPNLHLTGAEAGRLASEADVGLLLLTHHAAWNDEAEVLAEAVAEFDGPIEQAWPGMTIDLS
jgi:ribonuclease BN (tRNA processing enzyme)